MWRIKTGIMKKRGRKDKKGEHGRSKNREKNKPKKTEIMTEKRRRRKKKKN